MLTIPPAAATEELFDKAEAVLRRMLAVEPRNAAALARLACTRSPPWRAALTSETGASRCTAGSTAFGGAPARERTLNMNPEPCRRGSGRCCA